MELRGTVQGLSQVGSDTAEQQTGGISWKTEGTSSTAWKGALQTPERAGESANSLLTGRTPTSRSLLFFTSLRATEMMETSLYLHHFERVKEINPVSSLSKGRPEVLLYAQGSSVSSPHLQPEL